MSAGLPDDAPTGPSRLSELYDAALPEVYGYLRSRCGSDALAEELTSATLAPAFGFTKGVPLLKVPVIETSPMYRRYGPGCLVDKDTALFDLQTDPDQLHPVDDPDLETRLTATMTALMAANEAPAEAFRRLGLEAARG